MATQSLCSIPACGKRVFAREWCGAHYKRWHKYGDPNGGRHLNGELGRYFREVVMTYEGDECLIWPYTRNTNGYGMWDKQIVSRLVCIEVNGPPPESSNDAAHSCGKGTSGCVTKRHMSWKTRKGNMADAITHGMCAKGETHVLAKLTDEVATYIRSLKGFESQRSIADRHGISQATVSRIMSGESY